MAPAATSLSMNTPVLLAASVLQPRDSEHDHTTDVAIIVGAVVGAVVLICVVVAIIVPLARRRMRTQKEMQDMSSVERIQVSRKGYHRHEPQDSQSPLLTSLPRRGSRSSRGHVRSLPSDVGSADAGVRTQDRTPPEGAPLILPKFDFKEDGLLDDLQMLPGTPAVNTRLEASDSLSSPAHEVPHTGLSRHGTVQSSMSAPSVYSQASASTRLHHEVGGTKRLASNGRPASATVPDTLVPNTGTSTRLKQSLSKERRTRPASDAPHISEPTSIVPRSPPSQTRRLTKTKTPSRVRQPMTPLEEVSASTPLRNSRRDTLPRSGPTSLSPDSEVPPVPPIPSALPRLQHARQSITPSNSLRGDAQSTSLPLTGAFRESIHSAPRSSVAMSTSTLHRYPSITASSATYMTAPQSDLAASDLAESVSSLPVVPPAASHRQVSQPTFDYIPSSPSAPAHPADSDRSRNSAVADAAYPSKQDRERAIQKATKRADLAMVSVSSSGSNSTVVPARSSRSERDRDGDRPRRAHLREPDVVKVRADSQRRQSSRGAILPATRGNIEIVRHNYVKGNPVV